MTLGTDHLEKVSHFHMTFKITILRKWHDLSTTGEGEGEESTFCCGSMADRWGRLHLLIDTRPWRNIKFEASNCEASHFCEASQAYSHSHRHICKASHWYSHSNCIKGYSIRIRLVPIKYTSPHFSQNWHRGVFCSIAQPGEVPRLPTVGPSSRGPTLPSTI